MFARKHTSLHTFCLLESKLKYSAIRYLPNAGILHLIIALYVLILICMYVFLSCQSNIICMLYVVVTTFFNLSTLEFHVSKFSYVSLRYLYFTTRMRKFPPYTKLAIIMVYIVQLTLLKTVLYCLINKCMQCMHVACIRQLNPKQLKHYLPKQYHSVLGLNKKTLHKVYMYIVRTSKGRFSCGSGRLANLTASYHGLGIACVKLVRADVLLVHHPRT